MALPAATDVEYLGAGTSGGLSLGRSDDKVAFFGGTPVTKTAVTATAVTAIATTTLSQHGTSGVWAFASSTAGNALVTRVDQLQVDVAALITQLNTLGIV